jgi:hypothetical protein
MRKLFASNFIMIIAAALLAALGVVVSICARDFSWFARSGALITGIGIIVITRPSVIRKDIMLRVVMDESGLTQLDPEYYVRRNEEIPDWLIEDRTQCSRCFRTCFNYFRHANLGFCRFAKYPVVLPLK